MDLRAAFPVLDRVAYLNAGTNGPVPLPAIDAANARLSEELRLGRSGERHWEGLKALHERRREALARLMGCDLGEVALTRSTTDGVNAVLLGLDLRGGDEVVTSDQEHPGLLAPLAAARERCGIELRLVPFDSLANAVSERTRLVACSHVSWVNGSVADVAALRQTGVPLLLDGAQGLGAVPVNVRELDCDYYAASGQKWLCGPDGTGSLYVRAGQLAEVSTRWFGFQSLEDPQDCLGLRLHPDARRLDQGFLTGHSAAWSLRSIELLESAGWDAVHERAATLAARLADMLRERGLTVEPRGRTTLVAWQDPDPEARVKRMAAEDVVVRQIPSAGVMRASVGAWSSEEDLERLVALAVD